MVRPGGEGGVWVSKVSLWGEGETKEQERKGNPDAYEILKRRIFLGLFFSEPSIEVSQDTHYARGLNFHGSSAVWRSEVAGVGEGVELGKPGGDLVAGAGEVRVTGESGEGVRTAER